MKADDPAELATESRLTRGVGVALWRQIALSLEQDITSGRLAAGDRLPTEAALAARHNVNRHTVRRALEVLSTKGLLRIEQGRGSFVAEDVVDYSLGPRTRFSEVIRAQNREPEGRVLRMVDMPAEGPLLEALELKPGDPVVMIERLGLANDRPVVLGRHHFPLPRFEGMRRALNDQGSITTALGICGVADYRRAWTKVTARLPVPEEAAMLGQMVSRPVLQTEALSEDLSGRPIDYTVTCYAAGRVQLLIDGKQEA
ncbi:phosphonate metabolism transcriptional regulator PhnF [Pseudoroseomonas globiformis]|uniref:Phosphonate metabolism transcriptional regulator PhnF n=1 Tax=Teichococcus globiformis TaxID=2307229 RepID=A0ABV7FZJ5_9PROT